MDILRSAFCEFFWCVLILDYDSMCSEMDFIYKWVALFRAHFIAFKLERSE